jgi:hypothetical protein
MRELLVLLPFRAETRPPGSQLSSMLFGVRPELAQN